MTPRRSATLVLALSLMIATPAGAQDARPAMLTGKVQMDTLLRPIAGAEVSMPGLSRTVTANDLGEFQIANIPPGLHQITARKIGFARYDVMVQFKPGETVEKRIFLPRVTTLDSVRVVGDGNLPISFMEHRALGFGHFLTRAELEKATGRKLADVLLQVPGLRLVQGSGTSAWPMSKRYSMPIRSLSGLASCVNKPGEDVYCPERHERLRGMETGCYARVYLDRMLLNPHTPADPIDLKEFAPEQLEAIEYFSGPAQTPVEYAKLNSNCGVLVLHTRKSR